MLNSNTKYLENYRNSSSQISKENQCHHAALTHKNLAYFFDSFRNIQCQSFKYLKPTIRHLTMYKGSMK